MCQGKALVQFVLFSTCSCRHFRGKSHWGLFWSRLTTPMCLISTLCKLCIELSLFYWWSHGTSEIACLSFSFFLCATKPRHIFIWGVLFPPYTFYVLVVVKHSSSRMVLTSVMAIEMLVLARGSTCQWWHPPTICFVNRYKYGSSLCQSKSTIHGVLLWHRRPIAVESLCEDVFSPPFCLTVIAAQGTLMRCAYSPSHHFWMRGNIAPYNAVA